MSFSSQTNKFFYQIIGAAILALSGLGLLIWQLSPFFITAGRSLTHQLSTLCGCANHWHFANHPFIFSVLITGGIVFLGGAGFALFKITRLMIRTRSFVNLAIKDKKINLSEKLNKVARQAGLIGQIIEIEKEEPTIFCFGFRQPKICLSSSLVRQLNPAELRAALLHEKQHLLTREPARAAVVKILANLLFFLPGFSTLTAKYFIYSELSADERATANFRDKIPLAQALCKIIKWRESQIIKQNLALSFFSQVTEERINKLTDNNYQLKIKILTGQTFLKLSFLIVGLVLFLFSPRLVSAEKELLTCLEMSPAKNTPKIQCHWPTDLVKDCRILNPYTSTHSACSK